MCFTMPTLKVALFILPLKADHLIHAYIIPVVDILFKMYYVENKHFSALSAEQT